jgi:hypothetical protein
MIGCRRTECAGEEDERLLDGRDVQAVDPPHHDPVIAGEMFGDDFTLERGKGIGENRFAAAPAPPVEVGEPVRAGRSGAALNAAI